MQQTQRLVETISINPSHHLLILFLQIANKLGIKKKLQCTNKRNSGKKLWFLLGLPQHVNVEYTNHPPRYPILAKKMAN
jgi:hypothetical protein